MLTALVFGASLIGINPCSDCCSERLRPNVAYWVALAHEEQQKQRDPKHQADIDRDIEVGAKYVKELEKELKFSKNDDMRARLERVGNEMAKIANNSQVQVSWGDKRLSPYPYTFKLIIGKDVNAFSLPGGYIYFYEGLMNVAETDDELAAVVAHEISHAAFRHLAYMRKEQAKMDLITLPLLLAAILSGKKSVGDLAAGASLLKLATQSTWSENAEEAADYGGFQYMQKSRYNPLGTLTFIEQLSFRERQQQPDIDWGIFRTHPPTRERIRNIKRMLSNAGVPIRRSGVRTSLRAVVKPGETGGAEIWFSGGRIARFGGSGFSGRAERAARLLNEFFDQVPQLYELQLKEGQNFWGKGSKLFSLSEADAAFYKVSLNDLVEETHRNLKRALIDLHYFVGQDSGP